MYLEPMFGWEIHVIKYIYNTYVQMNVYIHAVTVIMI